MVRTEDKFGKLLPYVLKRGGKIAAFGGKGAVESGIIAVKKLIKK